MPNSDVIGHVLLVIDGAKSGYKAIEVSLKGYATVHWSETQGTGDDRRTVFYSSCEDYVANTAVLWSRESSPDGQLAAGSYRFQFSLRFQAIGRVIHGLTIPPTFNGTVGRIVYEVQAVIVRTSALKINRRVSVEFPYSTVVDPNLSPGVMLPQVFQVQKTLCCLCCVSGPISLTARIPRSGFCVGVGDAIPFEVDVDNGSNRQIRYLQATLTRRVIYTAQGHRNISEKDIRGVNRDTPIQPGNSSSWKPFPLSVPNIEPSITTCSIIELRYVLKVQAVISGAINPHVEFNLLLGNVPVSVNEGSQSFPPSAPPATASYPASIPTQGTPYHLDSTAPHPQPVLPAPQPATFVPPTPASDLPQGYHQNHHQDVKRCCIC